MISIPVGTRRICLFTGIRYTAPFPVSDCFGSGRRVPSVPVPCPDCPGTVFPDLHIGCEKLRRGAPPQGRAVSSPGSTPDALPEFENGRERNPGLSAGCLSAMPSNATLLPHDSPS